MSFAFRPRWSAYWLALLLVLITSACGFQLRGPRPLPFATVYLEMSAYTDLAAAIKRNIATSGTTRVVDNPAQAQVRLQVVRNSQEKVVLSLNAAGTAREYQLRQRFAFRVVDKAGSEVLPLNEIFVYRDISFNDNQVLAKEQEEALLYRDMENDLVQQLMRRLQAAKL